MNLNKEIQYAILICLYLTRAGRATIKDIAANLSLPKAFLDQIARKLRLAGVLESTKGPGGGYSLVAETQFVHVFSALSATSFLTKDEQFKYAKGEQEERAMVLLLNNLSYATWPILNRKISSVMKELVANEMRALERADESGLGN